MIAQWWDYAAAQWRVYAGPLLARIPDVSEVPTERMVLIGIIISLLLHLVVFLLIPLLSLMFPDKGLDFAKGEMKPREIELEVIPPEDTPPPFSIIPVQEQLFIDSRGLDIAKEAAENPIFESDENMRAASEAPAQGDLPLPGQQGKERPFNAFQTQRFALGPVAAPSSLDSPPPQPAPSTPAPPTPPTPPAPQVAQQKPPAAAPETKPPAPASANPEKKPPTETNEPTKPTKFRAVVKPAEDEIPLTKKESIPDELKEILKTPSTPVPVLHAAKLRPLDLDVPKPTPMPVATPQPTPQPQQAEPEIAKLTPAPRPQPPPHPTGYQPEQEQNHIESSISNRGKGAVDSIATPLARYRKQVNDAIGSRWYYYIRDKMDLVAFGSVRISFVIDDKGHISKTRVESNSSNTSLAEVSRRAIEEAEIPPPPRDPTGAASQEPLDWTLTFTYYPFSQ